MNIQSQRNLHFFLPEDQSLFDYDYIFSATAMWIELGMENIEATFDLTIRDLPRSRNFLLFTGLEEIITGILSWKYTEEDIAFLLERKIITEKTALKLKNFKFDGDIWAIPEGTVVFNNEPVVRITGKLWQINLFTFFLMNSLTSNTIFSSKLARCFLASQGKIYVATCSPVRGHAHEASLKFGRAAYLFGSASGMVPGFAKKFGIPYESKARAFHAFIKSFPSELDALQATAKIFPNASVMLDTYDLKQGINNVIKIAKEQKSQNQPVFSAVFIDSGKDVQDFADQAVYVRNLLDQNNLSEIQITVAGNFEEYRIEDLVKLNAPVDKVILGTEAIAPADDPKLEAVLKMAQFVDGEKTVNTAKLAPGKVSLPGVKQVFRQYDKDGFMQGDVIGLEDESLGEPLLKQFLKNGALMKDLPSLEQISKHTMSEMKKLSPALSSIRNHYTYSVEVSDELNNLLDSVRKIHIHEDTE